MFCDFVERRSSIPVSTSINNAASTQVFWSHDRCIYIYCCESQGGRDMNYTVPGYLLPYVLGGTVAIIAALLFGLHNALKRASWPIQERTQAVTGVAVVLVAWFI